MIKKLTKSWFILLIWMIILLFVFQTFGIIIHELGHYSVGKIFGCENLTINLAKLSYQDSISNVSGWENCNFPLVVAKDGSRICNTKTNLISFAGFFLTILIFIPLIILINNILRNKFNRFFLKKNHLILILIFVIIMALKSASWDFFKIGECLINTNFGNQIIRFINLLQIIVMPILIIVFILFDFLRGKIK